MSAKDGTEMMGLDRLNALFGWWRSPASNGNGNFEAQMKRFETFTSDLQKTYSEACSRQMQAAIAANERFVQSLQELMRCRRPEETIAAESNILAALLEGASLRAKTWAELTQKVADCCAALTRETVVEGEEQATREIAQPAVRQAGKQQARA
jgi:hypothetical protein